MAIQLNNIAHLHCCDETNRLYDPAAACAALARLQSNFPRSQWIPHFPEFLHTEALVEIAEIQKDLRHGEAVRVVLSRLEQTRERIEVAINASGSKNAQLYALHLRQVEKEIERLAGLSHE